MTVQALELHGIDGTIVVDCRHIAAVERRARLTVQGTGRAVSTEATVVHLTTGVQLSVRESADVLLGALGWEIEMAVP